MKLKNFLFVAVCATLLAGCSDDSLVKNKPVVPGSEVSFAVGLGKGSRTVYGEETTQDDVKVWPIYWVNGDRVNIFSPDLESPASPYRISVEGNQQNYATGITTINANGIQWGDTQPTAETPVRFYSIYPLSYKVSFGELGEVRTNRLEKNTNATEAESRPVIANLNIRRNQIVVFNQDITAEPAPSTRIGQPIDRASNTSMADCQQNPDAIMFAQTLQTTGGDVELQYTPLSTAIHIKINDITVANSTPDSTATVYGFKLTAEEGVQLVGNFTAEFSSDCRTAPTIKGNYQTGDNVINISTLDNVQGKYLEVSTNDTRPVEFNVFIIPQADIDIAKWDLEIETDHGDYHTGLTIDTENGGSGILHPGDMHKLNLATVDISGKMELKPESWMSEIPDNVYFTELTLPGAWYATSSEYQGSNVSIQSLYNAGVRAFAVETKVSSTLGWSGYTPSSVILSGTGSRVNSGQCYIGGTQLSGTISSLLQQVEKTPEEFAVLVLSYAQEGLAIRQTDFDFWLGGLKTQIENGITSANSEGVTDAASLIYGYSDGKILSVNTTVGDVRGKLIIKINMDSRFTASFDYSSIPVLYANTSYEWVTAETDPNMPANQKDLPLMSHGYWKKWDIATDTVNLSGSQFNWDEIGHLLTDDKDNIHMAYSNANRTKHLDSDQVTDSVTYDIPTIVERQNAIETLIRISKDVYEGGAHNVWFQIGAGGVRANDASSSTGTGGGEHYALHFNPFLLSTIEQKIADNNPSPLGLVFCNYITKTVSGQVETGAETTSVNGNALIKVILEMNNLFYLQRDPDWVKPGTQEAQQVKSVSPNHQSGYSVPTGSWEAI